MNIYVLVVLYSESKLSHPPCSQVSHSFSSIRKFVKSSAHSSNSSSLTSARLMRRSRQVEFIICNISNRSGLRRERRSVAVSLAVENIRSQGTEDAWLGRTSKAIRASVGYNFPFSYFVLELNVQWLAAEHIPTTNLQDLSWVTHHLACPWGSVEAPHANSHLNLLW